MPCSLKSTPRPKTSSPGRPKRYRAPASEGEHNRRTRSSPRRPGAGDGQGRFVDDIGGAGALAAAFARSPHPHALVRDIDRSAARAGPGVIAVLTLDDLAPVMKQRRMNRVSNSGTNLAQSWPFALADCEVSFVGEPVAIVIAADRYVAE